MTSMYVMTDDLKIDDHFKMAGSTYRILHVVKTPGYVHIHAYNINDSSVEISITMRSIVIMKIYNQ